MSRQFVDLEATLAQLVAEHKNLLANLDRQQAAMRKLDVEALESATSAQEASRLRIASLDTRRRLLVGQIAKLARVDEKQLTLAKLADLHPLRKAQLLALRKELTDLAAMISHKANIASRVSGAILGHLNTVVRIVAGAMEKGGMYTKQGVPRVSARIGMMEAVG
ncbi:MAG TPA: flagellar export chaperone FlgN [Tepidisphaeraceae bacterium]|jgi:chromosome segregation ATPase|nr:flagellar export chaperone FlgN [Tepidisphaeraceae bacterium]